MQRNTFVLMLPTISVPLIQSTSNILGTAAPVTPASDETDIYTLPKKPADEIWHSKGEINFIDHVVLVWLHRVRRGDRTIVIPDSVIKARGKEAAFIVNSKCKFYPTQWLRTFMNKLDEEDARGPKEYSKYPSVYIADIIKEERPKFFGKGGVCLMKAYDINSANNLSVEKVRSEVKSVQTEDLIQRWDQSDPTPAHDNFIFYVVFIWLYQARRGDSTITFPYAVIRDRAKEAAYIMNINHKFNILLWMRLFKNKLKEEDALGHERYSRSYSALFIKDIIKAERSEFSKFLDAEKDILQTDDTIQSYNELLDCLKMLQKYAIQIRNIEATVLVTQIEDIVMNEIE